MTVSRGLSYGSVKLHVALALDVVNQKESLGLNSGDWGRTFSADGPRCLHPFPLDSKPACLQEKVFSLFCSGWLVSAWQSDL